MVHVIPANPKIKMPVGHLSSLILDPSRWHHASKPGAEQ